MKPCHFMRDCPEQMSNDDFVQIVDASDEDNYESVGALVVETNI